MAIFVNKDDKTYYTTKTQLKITGSIIELRKYGREFFIGDRPRSLRDKTEKEGKKYSDEEIQDRRYRRAKRELLDCINCNVSVWSSTSGKIEPPIFVTLTFAENLQDMEKANHEFTKFIQRFNFLITHKKKSYLKYAVVIEFQKRGAIHFHALFFNLPYIQDIKSKLEDLWGQGFIQLKAITRVKNIARYMVKYMSKRFDDPRLRGKKCYFVSRNLKHPTLVYYDSLISQLLSYLPNDSIEYQRDDLPAGEYMLSVDLTRYNLQNFPEAKESALAFLESTGYDGPAHTLPRNETFELPNF